MNGFHACKVPTFRQLSQEMANSKMSKIWVLWRFRLLLLNLHWLVLNQGSWKIAHAQTRYAGNFMEIKLNGFHSLTKYADMVFCVTANAAKSRGYFDAVFCQKMKAEPREPKHYLFVGSWWKHRVLRGLERKHRLFIQFLRNPCFPRRKPVFIRRNP